MTLDKYLDAIQEDQIQEIEPVVLALGSAIVLGNFITFLMMGASLRRSMKVDKKLTVRINKILNETKWVVHKVADPSPNAFAIGGKHIFITTGLKNFLNEREIEAVLLHEIYHNKGWHIYKKMAYEYPLFYLAVSAAIGVSAGTGNLLLGLLAFMMIVKISKIPYNILIGRRHERKADEYAVKLGYSNDLKNALQKLEKIYLKQMSKRECGKMCQLVEKIDEAIDEHPTTKKRIENILKRADKLNKVLKTMSFGKIKAFVMKG